MAKWTPKKKRESGIEDAARRYMKSVGGWSTKFVSPGRRGVPDRIFSHKNCGPFAIEFKKEKKVMEELQDMVADEMVEHGWRVHRNVDSLDKAKAIIDQEVFGL